MPANLEFTLKNTSDEPLAMYIVNEPTPAGFRPNSAMLVRDENALPITSSDEFWTHIVKTIFVTADGLATLQAVLTVTLDPLTIARPHLHLVDYTDTEEVWSALDGRAWLSSAMSWSRRPPGWPSTTSLTTRPPTPTSIQARIPRRSSSILRGIIRTRRGSNCVLSGRGYSNWNAWRFTQGALRYIESLAPISSPAGATELSPGRSPGFSNPLRRSPEGTAESIDGFSRPWRDFPVVSICTQDCVLG